MPAVQGSESRLGQVILNLLINAAQAIPEGAADRNTIHVTTRLEGPSRVAIDVRDTGCGIPRDQLSIIFEPFFTTKPRGAGTGLGLAICQRIVTDLGGEILVSSEVGRGTTFTLVLPSATPPAAVESTAPHEPAADAPVLPGEPAAEAPVRHDEPAAIPRAGRILVIDDEPPLLRLAGRILSPAHEVVATTTAREALQWMADGQRFDLILCDLMMPEMTGMDLHAALLNLAPDQAERMVFMTGGVFTTAARTFLDTVPNERIDKPFDTARLIALVKARVR